MGSFLAQIIDGKSQQFVQDDLDPEIRRKFVFMLNTLQEMKKDGLITDF